MGRKVPSKRHRGVKNPNEQAARRNARLINKINCPPSNPDVQEIPKSLQRIMNFHKKLQQEDLKNTLNCARLENECNTKMKLDSEKGFAGNRDQHCPVIELKNDRHISGKNHERRKLGKQEILAAKRVAKLEIKAETEKGRDFSEFKDEIKFGEVVLEPPKLEIKPKLKAKLKSLENQAGKKDLLLKRKFHNNADVQLSSKSLKQQPKSLAQKKMLEEERKRVVQLYREMKYQR